MYRMAPWEFQAVLAGHFQRRMNEAKDQARLAIWTAMVINGKKKTWKVSDLVKDSAGTKRGSEEMSREDVIRRNKEIHDDFERFKNNPNRHVVSQASPVEFATAVN